MSGSRAASTAETRSTVTAGQQAAWAAGIRSVAEAAAAIDPSRASFGPDSFDVAEAVQASVLLGLSQATESEREALEPDRVRWQLPWLLGQLAARGERESNTKEGRSLIIATRILQEHASNITIGYGERWRAGTKKEAPIRRLLATLILGKSLTI